MKLQAIAYFTFLNIIGLQVLKVECLQKLCICTGNIVKSNCTKIAAPKIFHTFSKSAILLDKIQSYVTF